MKSTDLRTLIKATEVRIAAIKNDIKGELSNLVRAATKEVSRLEAYADALKGAAKLDEGAAPARSRGRKRKAKRTVRKAKTARATAGRKTRAVSKANGAAKGRSAAAATFRQGSLPDQVRAMVLKSQKPVHLNDVVKQLGGPKKASLQSIENRISGLARSGKAFVRTGTRTYGLLELGHKAG